jgi:D-beta-D-heptose 7-phosphate kinase/D-beta-D-heptose 1-phosphate adenosyltransferase
VDFSATTVLCFGDLMLDRFAYGEIERISPEAPVPVLRLTRTTEMLGGAGNVANNIAALGGKAVLIGLLGADAAGDTVRAVVGRIPGISGHLVETPRRPTICKTRYVASGQQVVRTDDESRQPADANEEDALIAALDAAARSVQAIVLSDYGKGAVSDRVIAAAVKAGRAHGIPVFVDPKSEDFARYHGVTCLTPNLKELAAASHMPVGDEASVIAAARKVMAHAGSAAILATRSEKGMILVEADGGVTVAPARAREVFDVSGAGDTAIAALALAHASGRSLAQAAPIANAAAGVVVSKAGTATAHIAEVMHELGADDEGRWRPPSLSTLARTASLVDHWKALGLTVGFTNGCFDLVHAGHIALLAEARGQCDRLIVALNTDASVSALKGPTRPINSLEKRAQVIAAIRYVDCVLAFDEETPLALIKRLTPDVLVKGADYTMEGVVGGDVVRAAGGRVHLAALVEGQSTSHMVRQIRDTDPPGHGNLPASFPVLES